MRTDERTPTRWPLPPRSRSDRKLAGVAGGLGEAWRVDPLLIRVAFAVLALFGGSGVALYCAGWLAMRDDNDEVSALEALGGRGKSSVSPALAIVLIVVVLGSMGSMFSWGLPFWPVLIGAIVLGVVVTKRRNDTAAGGSGCAPSGAWVDDAASRVAAWGENLGDEINSWFGGTRAPAAPADETASGPTASDAAPASGNPAAAEPANAESPEPEDLLSAGRTPPAWDPLGAAPFAWDLPDPTTTAAASASATPEPAPHRGPKPGSVIARIFLGLALITGAIMGGAVASDAWHLPWSAVTGTALAIVAVGLLLAALRGRGGRFLIGPGIFLAIVTLATSVSGISGTGSFGQQSWVPATVDEVQDSYYWNAGQVTLDLSDVRVPHGDTLDTDVTIGAGQVTVLLPPDTTVNASCAASIGQVNCLGESRSGVRSEVYASEVGTPAHGTITIDVRSNAGQAVLKIHE